MGELAPEDVYNQTNGRVPNDGADGKTAKMLAAALAAARGYCGWHVSPVKTETVEDDGPGGNLLSVKTLKVVGTPTVTENGRTIDAAWSKRAPGCASKRNGGRWSGDFGAIEVTLTHGFAEEQAADWRDAICAMVEEMSLRNKVDAASGRSSRDLTRKKVDDVELDWASLRSSADRAIYGVAATLDRYRIPTL